MITAHNWTHHLTQGQEAIRAGAPLTEDVVAAITMTPPDVTVTTECDPDACDPHDLMRTCIRSRTPDSRAARYALVGWQSTHHPTAGWYRAESHHASRPLVVDPLHGNGHSSAVEAADLIALTLTRGDHVVMLRQRLWFFPRLIVATTESSSHPLVQHAIAPITR